MGTENLHFLFSAPRSGSTWLARALNRHPALFATEHRLFGDFCEVWSNLDGSTAPRLTFDRYAKTVAGHYFFAELGMDRKAFVEEFQRGYAEFLIDFASRHSGKSILVDKITPYRGTARLVASQLRQDFPQSRVVQLVRDGRDVATSGVFDWLGRDAVGTPRHDFFVRQTGGPLERFFDDQSLTRWATHWAETVAPQLFPGETLEVRYETMLADHPRQLQRLFDFLGVAADSELAVQIAQATTFESLHGRPAGDHQPTAKARRGIAGDWKNWFTRADGRLFHELAGAALIRLGYEPDAEWVDRLPLTLGTGASS